MESCSSVDNVNAELDVDRDKRSFECAQEEWDAVGSVVPGFGIYSSKSLQRTELITLIEAIQLFDVEDMQEYLAKIKPVLRPRGLSAILYQICGPPKLIKELHPERDKLFCIAAYQLDHSKDFHNQVLQTIYKRLTGEKHDCPRFGRHWEQIGFQGIDPGTDLRGVGFLALINLLYLVMDPHAFDLALDAYKLSHHDTQNFPFAVMSINVTAIVLQTLREGYLNRLCNARRLVLDVVNEFYAGVLLHLYSRWKNERRTISQSGYLLKEVESFAKKNTKRILRNFSDFIKCRVSSREHRPSTSTAENRLSDTVSPSDITIEPDTKRQKKEDDRCSQTSDGTQQELFI